MNFSKNTKEYFLKEVDSTSLEIKRHVDEMSDMTFLFTDHQTNGKGRGEHSWESEDGKNILFSFLIKDKEITSNFRFLSLAIGCLLFNYLTSLKVKDVKIKWPNDIYVKDKKIAGILLEGDFKKYIIVGIGLNVNQKTFNDKRATSIFNVTNKKCDLEKNRKELFSLIQNELKNLIKNKTKIIKKVNENNFLKNKKIQYNFNNLTKVGLVQSITSNCSLEVLTENNKKDILISADFLTI